MGSALYRRRNRSGVARDISPIRAVALLRGDIAEYSAGSGVVSLTIIAKCCRLKRV